MEIVHRINRIRACLLTNANPPTEQRNALTQLRLNLDNRLATLTQRINPDDEAATTPLRRLRILYTADLYRLAATLYLLRVVPLPHDDEANRTRCLEAALAALDRLDVATSPWPLFVIACEAMADGARVQILRVLERMETVRGIGNIRVLRGIIEAFWKQFDLRADMIGLGGHSSGGSGGAAGQTQGPHVRWLDLVNCDTPVPWFI